MKQYFNPKHYRRRASRVVNKHILSHIENFLAPDVDVPLRHPPVFLVGAPRSGSTLAVQVISDALDVGYISNRHCQWFGAPVLAEKLFHPTHHRPASNYRSRQGETDGWHAPAECGEWWYRFFRRKPPYMNLDECEPLKMCAFRRSVAALTNAMDRPILFKNLYASLRIQAIAHHLPESLFIVTHRNEVDNGHSLLEARYNSFGDYATWFSVEPPQVEQLKSLPAHEQVIQQIRHIHQTINSDFLKSGVPSSKRFDLSYEQFCVDPTATVSLFRNFLAKNGCYVRSREVDLPASFSRRGTIRIESRIYEALSEYVSCNPTEM